MENKFIIGECQVVKCYEDSQNDSIWRISSLNHENCEFVVHVSHSGNMYITYFPNCGISFGVRKKVLKELCNYLISTGNSLQIRVIDTNTTLKNLCLAVGFRYLRHMYAGGRNKKGYTILYFPEK